LCHGSPIADMTGIALTLTPVVNDPYQQTY
jgi:hypothetical protein